MNENDKRNRAEGWKHAKLSGHENEQLVCEEIKGSLFIQEKIIKCAHKEGMSIKDVAFGGLNEKNVKSVLDDTTKSKTDIIVTLNNDDKINISLKKDRGGQVYLISVERFIIGYEKQYNEIIPSNIKKALGLFWGTDADIIKIIGELPTKYDKYEIRKHRLVGEVLNEYDSDLYKELVNWFSSKMFNIFDFCFSKGLAANNDDWADLLWYKNDLGEDSFDRLINLHDMEKMVNNSAEYGNKNGETTLQLSFGFVQWHSPTKKIPGDMQFHHSYDKIIGLIDDYTKTNK